MGNQDLVVYREFCGSFEEVGHVVPAEEGIGFSYSDSYLQNKTAQSISHVFPLREGAFSSEETTSFFEGILPEGSMRKSLSRAFHASVGDTRAFLERLNDESVGALVFTVDGELPSVNRGYLPLEKDDLDRFAECPREFAPRAARRSRLSLAGAQMKVGLFFDDAHNAWFYPQGSAPSSHIIKACDGSFSHQTINEAICMKVASLLGFEAAACHLVSVAGCDPLIAVKRFDRYDTGDSFLHRRHQEDFFQTMPHFHDKYEPTDGNYASHCARLISEESQNPFGDRRLFFSRLLLDWALGNADNHLKNHSMLWSEDWSSREVPPLYDITCTTIYPEVDREMGVSFGRSRRIDEVTRADVLVTAQSCGVGEKFAINELDELLETFPDVLRKATEFVCEDGFLSAQSVGEGIGKSFEERRELLCRG